MVKMESALDQRGCAIVRDSFQILVKTREIRIMKAIHQETSHGTPSKWTPERIEAIKRMRSEGLSYSDIAKKYDSNVHMIYQTNYQVKSGNKRRSIK